MTIIDKNENKAFHPSIDIKDNVLVLGFRIKKEVDKETNLFVVKTTETLQTIEDPYFEYGGQTYSIDKKKRLLSKLSQKWGADSLNTFVELSRDPLYKTIKPHEVYEKIREKLKRHVELENEADYTLLSAWIIGTYFFPSFGAYPYIHIKAPKGSGKSQCLNFLCQTAFNAVKARASLPALRDTVDALRGTYLMDQADALHRPHMEDFLDVLTDSYKREGGGVRKMVQTKNEWKLEEFDAYSPKGFASINQLPEDLRDRCIVVPLIRSGKNYAPVDSEDTFWKEVRGDLYVTLINCFQDVDQGYLVKRISYRNSNEIYGRRLELWLPIEVVLSEFLVPQEEIELAKQRFLSRYEFAIYQTSDMEVAVIDTVLSMMKGKDEIILRPKEIAPQIDTELFDPDDKFSFMSQKQKSTMVGRSITKFNLSSQKLPRDSQGEKYLFTREHVEKVYRGYFESKKEDTQTYTEEKVLETKGLLDDLPSVS